MPLHQKRAQNHTHQDGRHIGQHKINLKHILGKGPEQIFLRYTFGRVQKRRKKGLKDLRPQTQQRVRGGDVCSTTKNCGVILDLYPEEAKTQETKLPRKVSRCTRKSIK